MTDDPTSAETLAPQVDAGGSTALSSGSLAARYTLGELIGRGGMGEIWLARDIRIGRDVAVKLVRGGTAHGQQLARFLREARVQGRLEHPSIVPIHDLGIDEQGQPYFAMKRVTGSTLADILEQRDEPEAVKRWPLRTLLARLVDVCHAIEFAHRRDVVHRDLKPANIMLGDLGEVYVLDWGIARLVGDTAATMTPGIATDGIDTLDDAKTVDGTMLGTPGYMSPEQIRGGDGVDHRTDVYALGCILYEILVGRSPLPTGLAGISATLDAGAFRPRAVADVAPELDDICAAATEPDLARRTASAGKLADAIQRYLDGDRDLAKRRELVESYADAATKAFAEGGDAARPQAMLAAGKALTLDPTHGGALALVTSLLFTPPKQVPPEVEASLAAARVRAGLVQMRAGIVAYMVWFLFFPFLFVIQLAHPWPLVAVAILLLVNSGIAWYGWRRKQAIGALFYPIVMIHGGVLVLVCFMVSPLLLAPALATTSMTIFVTHPTVYRPLWVVGVHVVALVVPLVLELTHALPATLALGSDGLAIHPWFAQMSGTTLLAISTAGYVTQLLAAFLLASHFRKEQERAQQGLALQKWQLEKLLPTSTSE